MMPVDDAELLRRYAEDGSEAAFAEAVQRHLNLVFAAALRRVGGDAHLAQDVTQQVFTALARDAARLSRRSVLAGWLYTTTRFASAQVVRTERRRHSREQEAHTMHELSSDPESNVDWERLRPLLDDAMDALNERDREAVLLRFFERQSFASVAATLRLTEDAARMRVERALDKLHALLASRGIRSTTAALGAVLAHEALGAAPAGLAATVAGAALASANAAAPSLAFLGFMSTSKIAAGGAALLLLTLGTIGYYAYHQARSEREDSERRGLAMRHTANLAAQQQSANTKTAAPRDGGASPDLVQPQPEKTPSADEIRKETAAALVEPNPADRAMRLAAILQKLSPSNWRGIEAAFADEKKLYGRSHVPEWTLVLRRAGEIVGKEPVEVMLSQEHVLAAKEALTGWAAKDPAGALEWLSREASSDTRRQIMGAAIRGLLLAEPDLAISALEGIPTDRRKNYTNDFAAVLVQSVGLEKAEALINGMIARSTSSGTVGDDGCARIWTDFALIRVQTAYGRGNIEEAIQWLTPQLDKPYADQSIVVATVERYAQVAPEKAAAWLQVVNDSRISAQKETIGYRELLSTWMQNVGALAIGQWLQTQTGQPQYDRIALQYTTLLAPKNPAEAAKWAGTIRDPATKANALAELRGPAKGH